MRGQINGYLMGRAPIVNFFEVLLDAERAKRIVKIYYRAC